MVTLAEAEIALRQYNGQYCYDGDTCYVMIDGTKAKIRLLELDTPEISKPKCEAELELGLEARDYLNNLIANASSVEIKTDYEKDYFGNYNTYKATNRCIIIYMGVGLPPARPARPRARPSRTRCLGSPGARDVSKLPQENPF